MPRIFNEKELKYIREKLIEKGRELFGTYGLKKTSIEELAKSVGIAQGTFYKFFNSKEELYFTILELEHSNHDDLLKKLLAFDKPVEESLEILVRQSFKFIEDNPIISRTYDHQEYELLQRKLPPKQFSKHHQDDFENAVSLVKQLQEQGYLTKYKPEIIAGMLRSLFFIAFHKEEIGTEIYQEVIDVLCKVVAKGLVADNVNG